MKTFLSAASILLYCAAAPSLARNCELDGESINLDNGSTYAGKSGRMKCFDDKGELVSVDELRDGDFVGYEWHRDLWGNVHERTTNANGNSQGVAREFWPNGTLKEEGNYDDGNAVGTHRSFHKNGKLARQSYYEKGGGRAEASLELDEEGRLRTLQCGPRSVLPEDREPCGFAGERSTMLYRNGEPHERVTYAQGRVLRHEELDAAGNTVASTVLDRDSQVRRRFHPNGKTASELVVTDGFHVAEREWYMNGRLKLETTREAKERDARNESIRYRDDGTREAQELRLDQRRLQLTRYDEAGQVKEIEDYAEEGHLDRRRRFAPDGSITADETFYPDGSRK